MTFKVIATSPGSNLHRLLEKIRDRSFWGAEGYEESQNLAIILESGFFAMLRMTAKKSFSTDFSFLTIPVSFFTKEGQKSESSRIRILFESERMILRKALKGCKLPLELTIWHLLRRTLHLLLQKDMGVDGLRVNLCFKTTTVYSLRLKKSTLNLKAQKAESIVIAESLRYYHHTIQRVRGFRNNPDRGFRISTPHFAFYIR